MAHARSYYKILGVAPTASPQDIHRAYRKLAREYHPDVYPGVDAGARFHELAEAYEVLRDPGKRATYDRASLPVHAPAPSRRAPAFSPRRPARDVPRFIDHDLADAVRQTEASRPLVQLHLSLRFDVGPFIVRWRPW